MVGPLLVAPILIATISNPVQEGTVAWPATSPTLIGRWRADFAPRPAKNQKEDNDLATAFAGVLVGLMGQMKLSIGPQSAYTLSLMGVPFDGHFSLVGQKMRFMPERAMGMTATQWQSEEKAGKGKLEAGELGKMVPLDGELAPDGSTISLKTSPGEKGAPIVFRRLPPESSYKLTASARELPFVGTWNGSLDVPKSQQPKPKTKEEEQQQEMVRLLIQNLELDLHRDNSFELSILVDLKGKWNVSGNKLQLTVTGLAGMDGPPPKASDKKDEIALTISEGGRRLSGKGDKNGENLTFKRAG